MELLSGNLHIVETEKIEEVEDMSRLTLKVQSSKW